MRRVADHGLIEIANLDFDLATSVCDGSEIADVTIAADPDGRALGRRAPISTLQPFIEIGVLPRTYACAERAIFRFRAWNRTADLSSGVAGTPCDDFIHPPSPVNILAHRFHGMITYWEAVGALAPV